MKKAKGISLIVLIITIIVIIILATAVIVTIATNNPIKEANKAKYESDRDNMQAVFSNAVAKVMAENSGNVKLQVGQINTATSGKKTTTGEISYTIENAQNSSNTYGKIVFDKGENTSTKYYTGIQLPVYSSGETKWYIDYEGNILLEVNGIQYGDGEIIDSLKPGEKATKEKNQFADNEGNIATIPIDFVVVPGCETISKGLVISDDVGDTEINKKIDGSGVVANGNQFVWIPVNDMNKFVREEGYSDGILQTTHLEEGSEPLNYHGTEASEEEKEMYNSMMESVRKYRGFFMGRYEASNDGNDNVQSKKNKETWINIKWGSGQADLLGGAVEKAKEFYPKSVATSGKAVSILPFGVQWDETVRFLEKNYSGIEKNSTGYGNYKPNNRIKTGSNEKYALNHIYDIAGNAWEWTMEAYYNGFRIFRGGGYNFTEEYGPVSCRNTFSPSYGNGNIGFRVALYICL